VRSRITLKEVSARAGVSYQTVSKLLNHQVHLSQETEERIWQAVEELGYKPNLIARSLRSRRSHLIGYSWAPTHPDQVNPILDHFLQAMVQEAENTGYHLMAFPFRPGAEWTDAYRDLIDTNRVDGFVVSSVEYNDPRILFLLEQNFPFVAFGRSNPDMDFPFVDVDGAAGMRMVVNHLVEQGHQKIAILTWPSSSRVGQNRMEGIRSAMVAANLSTPAEWIAQGDGDYQFGSQAAQSWLDRPAEKRPTAIIAFNDSMAVGAMHAIQSRGLCVGEDIAVTGFDDTPMAPYLSPSLTSVRQPTWQIGERVMSMLLSILDGTPLENTHQLVDPQLIVRDSSRRVHRQTR